MSKSGIKGKNKHGKATTAAKEAKKRARKRNDRAWIFSDDKRDEKDSGKISKQADAWMFEPIGKEQRTTAQVKQELKHVEQELAALGKSY